MISVLSHNINISQLTSTWWSSSSMCFSMMHLSQNIVQPWPQSLHLNRALFIEHVPHSKEVSTGPSWHRISSRHEFHKFSHSWSPDWGRWMVKNMVRGTTGNTPTWVVLTCFCLSFGHALVEANGSNGKVSTWGGDGISSGIGSSGGGVSSCIEAVQWHSRSWVVSFLQWDCCRDRTDDVSVAERWAVFCERAVRNWGRRGFLGCRGLASVLGPLAILTCRRVTLGSWNDSKSCDKKWDKVTEQVS